VCWRCPATHSDADDSSAAYGNADQHGRSAHGDVYQSSTSDKHADHASDGYA
jgi:hypothetical protein